MGIIGAVSKGFNVATKGLALVLVLFIFNVIWNLISMPFVVAPGATPTQQATVMAMVLSVAFILASIFVQGGSLAAVRDCIKEGKMKLGSFASNGAKYYIRLLLLGIVIILVIAIVALAAGLLIAVTAPLNNRIVTAIAAVIAAIIGLAALFFYFIPLTLSPYALVFDESGVIEAMKKSLKVAKKPLMNVLWLFLLFIILVLISLGVGFVVGFLVGLLTAVLPATAGRIAMAVATSAVNGYLGVVMMASFMSYYMALAGKSSEKII